MAVSLSIFKYDSKRQGSFKSYVTAQYLSDELPRKQVVIFDIELYCDRLQLESYVNLMQLILDSMYSDRFVTLLIHDDE